MFGKKWNPGVTIGGLEESASIRLSPKKVLTVDELDAIFQLRSVKDLQVDEFTLTQNEICALKLMGILEKIGQPIVINKSWYIYSIPTGAHRAWLRWTGLEPYIDIPVFLYAFPMPIQAIEKLRMVWAQMRERGITHLKFVPGMAKSIEEANYDYRFFHMFVASANPTLGRIELPEGVPMRAVLSDPMLVAAIRLFRKDYFYELATCDLSLDLSMAHEQKRVN